MGTGHWGHSRRGVTFEVFLKEAPDRSWSTGLTGGPGNPVWMNSC